MKQVMQVLQKGFVGEVQTPHKLKDGHSVVNFSLASTAKWRDKDGEDHERTTWNHVEVFFTSEKALEAFLSKVKKGTPLDISGVGVTQKWTAENGEKRSRLVTRVKQGDWAVLDLGRTGAEITSGQDAVGAGEEAGDDGMWDDDIPL